MTGQSFVGKLNKNHSDVNSMHLSRALDHCHLGHFHALGDTTKALPSFMVVKRTNSANSFPVGVSPVKFLSLLRFRTDPVDHKRVSEKTN